MLTAIKNKENRLIRSLPQTTLEKEMATHSSILAWKIPWTEEPDGLGGLQSMGSQSDVTERLTLSLRLHTALL